MISSISKAVCVTPRHRAFRDIALILFLSSTVSCPAKAGNAYVILNMIRPVNNWCRAWTAMPCDLSCDKRYKRWFICSSILFTYAAVERVEVMSIPSNVAWVTRSMSGIGGGILRCPEAGRWKIISFVLSVLIVRLFLADQAQILSYSRQCNAYGAVIVAEPLREFIRFIWWM